MQRSGLERRKASSLSPSQHRDRRAFLARPQGAPASLRAGHPSAAGARATRDADRSECAKRISRRGTAVVSRAPPQPALGHEAVEHRPQVVDSAPYQAKLFDAARAARRTPAPGVPGSSAHAELVLRALIPLGEPLACVLADRLQHPVPLAGEPQEALLDERLQRVEIGVATASAASSVPPPLNTERRPKSRCSTGVSSLKLHSIVARSVCWRGSASRPPLRRSRRSESRSRTCAGERALQRAAASSIARAAGRGDRRSPRPPCTRRRSPVRRRSPAA